MAAADQDGAHGMPFSGLWRMVNNCCISNIKSISFSYFGANYGRHVRPLCRRRLRPAFALERPPLGLGPVIAAGPRPRPVRLPRQCQRRVLAIRQPLAHRVGNWILAHGGVPTTDTFSFTFAGQPWIAKEWLSQLALAGAFNLGGWAGVTALCAAAIAITFALLLRLLLVDLKPLPRWMFVAAALIMMAPHLLARPHVLAFPLILLWVAGLVRAVEQRRRAGTAAAGHDALGQHAWCVLHIGADARGRLRARRCGRRARCP